MKCKRLTVVLTAICLMMTMLCPTLAAPVATFTVGTVSAAPGETVTVPLSITAVSDISGIAAHLCYDTSVLECVSAQPRGMMLQMDMSDANPAPVNAPGEVWLSGMGINGVAGSGEIMVVTFKVKDTAPSGLSAITFSNSWKPELLGSDANVTELEYTLVTGGVNVTADAGDAPAKTTQPVATTAPTVSNDPVPATQVGEVTTAPTTAAKGAPTLADGQTVPVTEETAVDVRGDVVTHPNGEAVKYQTVAVMLNEVTVAPSGEATLTMSLSAVEGLTAMFVNVSYDTQALEYVGYTVEGFAKDMNMVSAVQSKDGLVTLSGTDPLGVSGSGDIATLTFKAKSGAKSGEYRLAMASDTMLIAGDVELPFKTYTGVITVSGETASVDATYVVVAVVAAIAAAVVVVLIVIARRKKAKAPATKTTEKKEPPQTEGVDVSGEE